jgi:hypothetical protein
MTQRLPRFLITPSMAADVFRTYDLHLDIGTVRRWLLRHCREIEREFRYIPEQLIEDVVLNVCSQEWPDPAFDRMYKAVDQALSDAIADYQEAHLVQWTGSTWDEGEFCGIVHEFLAHSGEDPLTRRLMVHLLFDADITVPLTGDLYTFNLTLAGSSVAAVVLDD